MKFTRRVLLFGSSCLATIASLPRFALAQQTTKLTFVLVNDIYLMNEEATVPDGRKRGGFARLAAVVKAERARAAANGSRVIFAHAGDTLSPSLMSGIDQGFHIIALINMVAPDIFVPGNHEFDFGKDVFLRRMREAKFPLYAANMRNGDGAPLPGFADRKIVEIGGIRIGLTGAALEETPRLSNSGDVKFTPLVESVEAQARALKSEGADFIVAVVHAARDQDVKLYTRHAADLVLTGHDHDLYLNYDGRTAIVESTHDAYAVTMIDVTIGVEMRGDKRRITWLPRFRVVDTADVEPDPEVLAVVHGYEREMSHEFDTPIATTTVELDSREATVRTGEATIGALYADALRVMTDSDIGFMNGGGMRGAKIYRAGSKITRRDVLAELPFGNRLSLLAVSGKTLREVMEHGLGLMPRASGRFPQISGFTCDVDLSRAPGQRVLAMRINGAPLDESKIYRLATNDFLARGGDDYVMLRDARRIMPDSDNRLMANDVMVYLRKIATIEGDLTGRIVKK